MPRLLPERVAPAPVRRWSEASGLPSCSYRLHAPLNCAGLPALQAVRPEHELRSLVRGDPMAASNENNGDDEAPETGSNSETAASPEGSVPASDAKGAGAPPAGPPGDAGDTDDS